MRTIVSLVFLPTAVYSAGATVCEVLDHRMEQNGKEVEVIGHLGGTVYTGFFVYEKRLGAPCEYRWIFSWPSALGLFFEGQEGPKRLAELKRYGASAVDVTVKGRLFTRSDYYVINLLWRPQRPIGRYRYGGVAGAIAVTDIRVKEISSAVHQ
jgi:hypothetical protein